MREGIKRKGGRDGDGDGDGRLAYLTSYKQGYHISTVPIRCTTNQPFGQVVEFTPSDFYLWDAGGQRDEGVISLKVWVENEASSRVGMGEDVRSIETHGRLEGRRNRFDRIWVRLNRLNYKHALRLPYITDMLSGIDT